MLVVVVVIIRADFPLPLLGAARGPPETKVPNGRGDPMPFLSGRSLSLRKGRDMSLAPSLRIGKAAAAGKQRDQVSSPQAFRSGR